MRARLHEGAPPGGAGAGVGGSRACRHQHHPARPPDDPESFRHAYGGDPLDDEALAYVVDPVRCVADTVHHYLQPVCWSLVAGIPVTYVLNVRDRPVPTETQRRMVAHLPGPMTVVPVNSGHLLPVTDPGPVRLDPGPAGAVGLIRAAPAGAAPPGRPATGAT